MDAKSGFTRLTWRKEQSVKMRQVMWARCLWRIKRKAAGTSGLRKLFFFFLSCETCQVAYQTCITCLTARSSTEAPWGLVSHGLWHVISHVIILSFGCTVLFRQREIHFDFVIFFCLGWITFLLNASPTLRPDHSCACWTYSSCFIIFILKY